MRRIGAYDIEDPTKIQGRHDVSPRDWSTAALRLRHALSALECVEGRVLVLGCGAGRYVRALERERPDLTFHAGDLSLTAVHEARAHDPHGRYVALESTALPYRDGAFAAVVFFDLLEHVPGHRRMLAEIARVLEAGGVLHLFVPLEGRPGTLYWLLRYSERWPIHRWKRDHVGHIARFDATDVFKAVWDAGLEVRDVSYGFHLVGQIHDVIDYWQRERSTRGGGLVPPAAAAAIARAVFVLTWRLAYFEDRLYAGPRLASGLHLTARRPAR